MADLVEREWFVLSTAVTPVFGSVGRCSIVSEAEADSS